jgi:hypothetical protein
VPDQSKTGASALIHYHGTPITPDTAAATILKGRHAMVSFANPEQLALVSDICQSFALDNGAFTAWKRGGAVDWSDYVAWIVDWHRHPGFDWYLIPDVIDGDEESNDDLLSWCLDKCPISGGIPVWHLHEGISRLLRLAGAFPRIAFGSSGEFAEVGAPAWWNRMAVAMRAVCDPGGRPKTKLHGLRMLDPKVFSRFPFSSADSTNVARNIGLDGRWPGTYRPPSKAARGIVLAERIEAFQSAPVWDCHEIQHDLFAAESA